MTETPTAEHRKFSSKPYRVMAVSALAVLLCASTGAFMLKGGFWRQADDHVMMNDLVAEKRGKAPDYLYKNATGSYLAGKFDASQGEVRKALRHIAETMAYQPRDKQLLRQAYRLSILAGEFDQAEDYAKKLPESEQDRRLNPRMLMTVLAVKRGDYTKATELLEKMPPDGTNALFMPMLQGWVQLGKDKTVDVKSLEESLKVAGQFKPLLRYQMALLLDAAGKVEAARAHYDAVNKTSQLSLRIAEVLANFYERQGNREKLIDLQTRYARQYGHGMGEVAKTPIVSTPREGVAEIFYGIGSVLFSLEAYAEAQVPLQIALDLRPDFDAAHFLQANLLERQERVDEAIAAYEKLKDHPAFGMQAQVRMAYCYHDSDRSEKAMDVLAAMQQQFPVEVEPLLTKADILRADKKYDAAIALYTQALDKIGDDNAKRWPVYYARGVCYERSDAWGEAEADFLEALRLEPDQPDVLNYLGYSWLLQNKYLQQAREMIEKAMLARPQDAQIIDSMGWAMYHLGNYEEALEYMEQAIALAPRDPTVNEHLGDVYWRMGYQLQAKYQWERALLFEPEEPGQAAGLRKKIAEGLPETQTSKPKMLSQNVTDAADVVAK